MLPPLPRVPPVSSVAGAAVLPLFALGVAGLLPIPTGVGRREKPAPAVGEGAPYVPRDFRLAAAVVVMAEGEAGMNCPTART